MKLVRAVLGRLDPWAALLLGVLVALGVVILLATPGPWHKVVGPAPAVKLAPPPPNDVAVYALGGAGGRCSGVAWLHIDHAKPSLTAIVLAPDTQVFVPGAGFTPLRSAVDYLGPAAATAALGQTVETHMDAWVALDQQALKLAVAPTPPNGSDRAAYAQYRAAHAAWIGQGPARKVWPAQYRSLATALARSPFESMNVVAFSNYVLGFGHVTSDLNLQGSTSLATTFKALLPEQMTVSTAAAIVETCRLGRIWRVDRSALEELRQSLALGFAPPSGGPQLTHWPRDARVLVVLPGARSRAGAYVRAVRAGLRSSAGAPVGVRVLPVTDWDKLGTRTVDAVESYAPLAVLVAPPARESAAANTRREAAALRTLGQDLRGAGVPAVLSEPLPEETTQTASPAPDGVLAAVRAGGQPVSSLGFLSVGGAVSGSANVIARRAAAANVATLVRACWSGALAPRLASTRLGFPFAARRRTTVAVVSGAADLAAQAAGRLQTWGYRTTVAAAGSWKPTRSGRAVFYRAGMRRAALALAGDLGLPAGAVLPDPRAPAGVTLLLPT